MRFSAAYWLLFRWRLRRRPDGRLRKLQLLEERSASSCDSSQLRASLRLQGATQSVVGPFTVTNVSKTSCSLDGTPLVALRSTDGAAIAASQTAAAPFWADEGSPKPAGWPLVTVAAGGKARVKLQFINWCGGPDTALKVSLALPGQRGKLLAATGRVGGASCISGKGPVRIRVGPFEPVR